MTNDFTTRPMTLFHGAMTALLFAGVLAHSPDARAESPKITAYCRAHVHPGIPMSYYIDGVKTPPTCIDGKSPRKQKPVDMAVACQMTSGSPAFRYVDGSIIDCSPDQRPLVAEGSGVQIVQPEDLERYCGEWYGAGSTGEHSAAADSLVCTSAAGPQTVNFMLLCESYYKTGKVRYVKDPDRHYVACVK